MNGESGVTMRRGAAAMMALGLLLAGAAGTYLLMRTGDDAGAGMAQTSADPSAGDAHQAHTPPPGEAPADGNDARRGDVTVQLTADAVERAGIVVTPAGAGTSAAGLRLPGVVAPNAYRQVVVTPLVAGRVTRVSAELGDRVTRGQTLAQIHSPELAEAYTRFISARALLDAHDRELQRTERLVEIGAASRQELERVHAEHAAQAAEVESARSRLDLLGAAESTLDPAGAGPAVSATRSVPSPIDGVVTERAANAGVNVDPSTPLFTVADLSTVWVVADLYEKDFAAVRVGSTAVVTTAAYPDLALQGRVGYIDPQVRADTRTAQVRVEVPNSRGELRLGMYANVVVSGSQAAASPTVPRSAVQQVGDRTVVYLADPAVPGRFVEREVRLGASSGEQVAVASGVRTGDPIVTTGSFFVRAERERLGLKADPGGTTTGSSAAPGPGPVPAPTPSAAGEAAGNVQTARIVVGDGGYEPATIALRAGTPARLVFVRTSATTCGTEIVFPSLGIRKALPLNEPVSIEFTPAQAGAIGFVCGMDMLRGSVVVR